MQEFILFEPSLILSKDVRSPGPCADLGSGDTLSVVSNTLKAAEVLNALPRNLLCSLDGQASLVPLVRLCKGSHEREIHASVSGRSRSDRYWHEGALRVRQ